MRLKTAVKQARKAGCRYIQRDNGNTLLDVVRYHVDHLDMEDVYSDDWMIPDQERITYFK